MARKAQYQTKQMAELLAFLKSVPGSHVTVNDICEHHDVEMASLRTVFYGICSECRQTGC